MLVQFPTLALSKSGLTVLGLPNLSRNSFCRTSTRLYFSVYKPQIKISSRQKQTFPESVFQIPVSGKSRKLVFLFSCFGKIPNAVFTNFHASGKSRGLFFPIFTLRENPDGCFSYFHASGKSRKPVLPFFTFRENPEGRFSIQL